MSHKFKIGQRVRRTSALHSNDNFAEVAEVVRLMPADQTGEVSYRIRSGFAERAALERELTAVSGNSSSDRR